MECNRDEAVRAKAIAESKLQQKDYVGARKFALKAQTLFPGLDGISQLLTTLDVYVCAENKIAGEVDWYRVLNVNPTADEDAIRKQYRRLALMLHPDKNSSVGADGAFKLISEAHSLLGNKDKRSAYNKRRGFTVFQPYTPTYTGVPSAPNTVPSASSNVPSAHTSDPSARPSVPSARASVPLARPSVASTYTTGPAAHTSASSVPPGLNPFFNFAEMTPPIRKAPKKCSKTPAKATSSPNNPPRADTFWTLCRQCNTQYEYLKIYRNYTLLCPNCNKPFMALETAAPGLSSKPKPHRPSFFQRQQSSNVQNENEPVRNVSAAHKSGAGQAGPSSGTAGTDSRGPVLVSQVQTKVKRSRSGPPSHVLGGNSALAADLEAKNKKRKRDGVSSGLRADSKTAQGEGGSGTASASESKVQGGFGTGSASVSDAHGSFGTANASGSNVHGSFGTASASASKVPGGFGTASASGLRVPGGFGTLSASGSRVSGGFGTASASGSKAYGVFGTTSTSGLHGGFGSANASGSTFRGVSGSYPNSTRGHGFSRAYYQPKSNNIRNLTCNEARTLMITKSKSLIQNKLSAWRSDTPVNAANLDNGKSKEPSKETHNHSSKGHDKNNKSSESSAKKTAEHAEKSMASHSAGYEVKENPEADLPLPMTVPDPDCHDFDKDASLDKADDGTEEYQAVNGENPLQDQAGDERQS